MELLEQAKKDRTPDELKRGYVQAIDNMYPYFIYGRKEGPTGRNIYEIYMWSEDKSASKPGKE